MNLVRWGILGILLFLGPGCGYISIVSRPELDTSGIDPELTSTLLELTKAQENSIIRGEDYPSDSFNTLVELKTPAGYRIKLRYTQLGASLVEALKVSRDRGVMTRLFEMAQWSENDKMRSEALVTLGSFSDPKDISLFTTAMADNNVGIRFAAIEALQLWGQNGTKELLTKALNDNWSPLLRVFAAQALLSLSDPSGLDVLYELSKDRSWIVRAMAARYLGDFAPAADYSRLLEMFTQETSNDFVTAELAIATLKLLSQAKSKIPYSPLSKGWIDNQEVQYTIGPNNVIEVEPLILIPPQIFIPEKEQAVHTINRKLLFLIQNRLDSELSPVDISDPNLSELNQMVTPTGTALKTRYSELSIPIVEGLGGTKDPGLRSELESFAQGHSNSLVQASALLALAYDRNILDYTLINQSLYNKDTIVRFGAMEAVLVGRFTEALPTIRGIAYADDIPAFRIFAMQILISLGDDTGRVLLSVNLDNPDWPARAMAFWYLGRYGQDADYSLIRSKLASETNPFVKTEMALATARLTPL